MEKPSTDLAELLVDYPAIVELPIAWGDMDAFQHVNNTRYFRYFEDARIAYFTEAGISTDSGFAEGIGPILASTSCRFKAPVTYPDRIGVGARIVDLQEDRFTVEHAVASQEHQRIVATGRALIVAYDYQKNHKAKVPDSWRRAIERLEG